jgi:nitroreductase
MTVYAASRQPLAELGVSEARLLVADAARAPSVHNSQPWVFTLRAGSLELRADPTRHLRVVDRRGQAEVVSCGAAMLGLRLSAAVRLQRQLLVRTLVDPADPALLATVTLGRLAVPSETERRLHAALSFRHTYRGPMHDRRLGDPLRRELRDAAEHEGARLVFTGGAGREFVVELTREADLLWERDAAYRSELAAWTRTGSGAYDGVPVSARGSRDWHVPQRDFSAPGEGPRPAAPSALGEIALLVTPSDNRRSQLAAGAALHRLLLTAASRAVDAAPMQQAVEHHRLRGMLGGPEHRYGAVQAVVRVGFRQPGWETEPAGRRPVDDVLTISL